MTKYSQMVCLVGENPLPIYLSIRQFAEEDATVWLVHSNDTFEVAKRVRIAVKTMEAAKSKKISWKFDEVENPYHPEKVWSKLEILPCADAILNYTGGTKVMSAFSVLAWKDYLKNIFYLDESSAMFFFGQSVVPIPLSIPLTIAEICTLHSVVPKPTETGTDAENTLEEDLRWVWSLMYPAPLPKDIEVSQADGFKVSAKNQLDQKRYSALQDQFDTKTNQWLVQMQHLIAVLASKNQKRWELQSFPNSLQNAGALLGEFANSRGWWMEMIIKHFVGRALTKLQEHDANKYAKNEVVPNQKFSVFEGDYDDAHYEEDRNFESDITVIVGHGLRYISSTVKEAKADGKGKAFEAMHRAQQVGGGLAKSLTVTGLDETATKLCNSDINASVPFASRRHTVLGRHDVDAWFNGNLDTLTTFLQS